ncbi:unnamed protein product, partial [Brenthis ino]
MIPVLTTSVVYWLTCTAADPEVLGSYPGSSQVQLLNISTKKLSVTARGWEVFGVTPPYLKEHVKPSDLRFNSHRSCRIVVPMEYESDRNRECTCLRAHALHYNITCADG